MNLIHNIVFFTWVNVMKIIKTMKNMSGCKTKNTKQNKTHNKNILYNENKLEWNQSFENICIVKLFSC